MNIAGQFPPYAPMTDNDRNPVWLSLLELRDFLGREWRLIALVTGLSIALGAAYIAMSPYKYTAHADMFIDTKRVVWTQSEMASENRSVDDAWLKREKKTPKPKKPQTP